MRAIGGILALVLAIGVVGCGHPECSGTDAVYDGPPTSVEWNRLDSPTHQTHGTYVGVVRVELHGEYVKLVYRDGRVELRKGLVLLKIGAPAGG